MLKSFLVDNFKSLINVTFEPSALNLLVGSNNAGKTNLCHALRFLSLTTRMSLDDAAAACTAEPWNLLNVYIEKQSLSLAARCDLKLVDETLSFHYELNLASERAQQSQPRGRLFSVSSETLKLSGGKFADTVLLDNSAGNVRLLHEKRFLKGSMPSEPAYVDTVAPTDTTMLCRLYDLETNQRSNLFKKYLGSWGYYNFDPIRLRSNQARAMDSSLESSGSNLSSFLFTLHNARPRIEKKLLEAMRLLEPRLDLFSFQAPDPDHVYMFFEDGQGNRFGLDNVSDGTLRYLAMCCLIIAGTEAGDDRGGPPVTVIEEPENGIFVGHLRHLIEKVDRSGQHGQFIFTSHNPYFIDLFDATLEGVFVVRRGETHSSLVRPDPATLRERLGKFSPGEMHFRGLIE